MLIVSIAKVSPVAVTFLAMIIVMSLLAVIVIFEMMCRTARSRPHSNNLRGILLALRGKPDSPRTWRRSVTRLSAKPH